MSNLFFTSDTHFGHFNIIKYSQRPFSGVEHMDESMIYNWNQKVKPSDEVWHLGDFAFATAERIEEIIKRLNGKINFLKGNHDKETWKKRHLFVSYQEYKEITIGNQKIVLCHFPLLTWNKAHRGAWHLQGHCHGSINHLNEKTTRLDVGVDNFNYTPVSFEEVSEILSKKEYDFVDHHK